MFEDINFKTFTKKIFSDTVDLYAEVPSECPNVSIEIVDDIFKTIYEEDREFFEDTKLSEQKWLGGLMYVDKNNQTTIYVKSVGEIAVKNIVNFFVSCSHEIVHYFDYVLLGNYTRNSNLRILQDNIPFLFWTEFHATYFSYLYGINKGFMHFEKDEVLNELKKSVDNYLLCNTILYLQPTVDFSSRLFGKYKAWKAIYNDLPEYPLELFINTNMARLFEFLNSHSLFGELKEDISDLEKLMSSFEQKGKRL